MSFIERVRSWWHKHDLEEAEEKALTQHEQDVVDEGGFQGRESELEAGRGGAGFIASEEVPSDFDAESGRR